MNKMKPKIYSYYMVIYLGIISFIIASVIPVYANNINNTSANVTIYDNQSITNITHDLATGNITAPPDAINRSNETPKLKPTPPEPPYKPEPSPNPSIIIVLTLFFGVAICLKK